jgi:hypothetical protein
MSIPVLISISNCKNPGLLGEVADSGSGARCILSFQIARKTQDWSQLEETPTG